MPKKNDEHKLSVGGRRVVTLSYNADVADPLWKALDDVMRDNRILNERGEPSLVALVRRLALLAMHEPEYASDIVAEMANESQGYHDTYMKDVAMRRGSRTKDG